MVGSTIFFSCAGVTYVPLAVAQILSDTMRIGKSKRKAHSAPPPFPSPFLLFGPRFVSASRIRVRTAGRFNHLHCTQTTSSTLSSFLATRREFQHSFDSLLYARCPRLFRKQRGPLSISPWKSDYGPWSIVAAREFSSFDCRENDTMFIYSNISRIHSPRYIYLGQRGGKFKGRYRRLKHLR